MLELKSNFLSSTGGKELLGDAVFTQKVEATRGTRALVFQEPW